MIEAQVVGRVEKAPDGQSGAEQRVGCDCVEKSLQTSLALGDKLRRHITDKAFRGKREMYDAQ